MSISDSASAPKTPGEGKRVLRIKLDPGMEKDDRKVGVGSLIPRRRIGLSVYRLLLCPILSSKQPHKVLLPPFYSCSPSKAQRGKVTHLRSHSWWCQVLKFYLTPNSRLLSDICMAELGTGLGLLGMHMASTISCPLLCQQYNHSKALTKREIDLKLPSVERLSGKLWTEETFPFGEWGRGGAGKGWGVVQWEEARSKRTKLLVEDSPMQWLY